MLQYKSTIKISELKKYFSSSEKTVETIFSQISSLKISDRMFQAVDKCNTRYSGKQKFMLLLLFPLFQVKHISDFAESAISQAFKCGKDVFYEFLNSSVFDWRRFSYTVNKRLLKKVKTGSEKSDNEPLVCLIADDTDLPKSGRRFELLSRIYSHVTNTFRHGYKGLFLGLHDGKSFFALDFSLHGEKGNEKNENYKPYGLTDKQLKARFSKKRNKDSACKQRVNEYFKKKPEMLISMIKNAIRNNIRFDYLLTDSWFTIPKLIKFIASIRFKCFFLGMVKKGNTKYFFNGKSLILSKILSSLKHSKRMSHSKKLRCWFYEAEAELQGVKIKLLFCRTSKRGKWNCLLTTNTELKFEEAYEIYATRWSIEVFFKECKQYLRLGKCESRDFDAQIAATTLCMLQYNLLSVVKRFEGYESFGALFREAKAQMLELNVKERIWLIIIDLIDTFCEFCDLDVDKFMEHLIADNQYIKKLSNLKNHLEAA
jgi:hypothetical protein